MESFRASPWIPYEPSESKLQAAQTGHNVNQDVDMDAPQISTLREEETPPPQPTRTSKFRVKLLVNDTKRAGSSSGSVSRTPQDEGDDEDEEEEDQLIDDDDDMNTNPSASLSRHIDASPKRKSPNKRKPRKTEKRIAEDERTGHKTPTQVATPPRNPFVTGRSADDSILNPEPLHPKLPLKRKPLPRRVNSQRSKGKGIALIHRDMALFDDGGNFSETYTAASSPITFGTPEPESVALPIASADETNLDFVPLPIYPLPSKPFPVQPPPKIGTGFAPIVPLDRSGLKVRHWRTAHREIRGIAGGRWFARAWVGDKDSEYVTAGSIATASSASKLHEGVALPKLPPVSIAAPPSGKGSSRGKLSRSQVVSANHSRASSVVADVPNSTRAPTKMRTMLAASSVEGGND